MGGGEQFWPAPRGNPCSILLGCGLSFFLGGEGGTAEALSLS